jgi:hypothetical protein
MVETYQKSIKEIVTELQGGGKAGGSQSEDA